MEWLLGTRHSIAASTEEAADVLSFAQNKLSDLIFQRFLTTGLKITIFTSLQHTCFPSSHQVAYS
jgi:hypothetical protein